MHKIRKQGAEDDQGTGSSYTEGVWTHSSSSAGPRNPTSGHVVTYALHPVQRNQLAEDQERRDAITPAEDTYSTTIELGCVQSQAGEIISSGTRNASPNQEHSRPLLSVSQGVPVELASLLAEIIFVLTCTGGQLVSALLIGHVAVTQAAFGDALGILPSQLPWLLGSSSLAAGLSVIIAGSLADLTPPKPLMVGGFLWSALWNLIAALAISPRLKVLFFVARAMQGLAAGVLVSASMSILGRVYNPGIRKTRVFSLMAAGSPFGYWLGCLQAGALSSHLAWIFGSTAILITGFALTAYLTIPSLRPSRDTVTSEAPSLRHFDYIGAGLAAVGCGLIVFGLTQGSSAHWDPYTFISIILGFFMLGGFYLVEKRVARPLVPNKLWQTPGFTNLLISYFLGLGAYSKFSKVMLLAREFLTDSSNHRWRMAILRYPILAALSKRYTTGNSTLPPSERDCGHPGRVRRVENNAPRAYPCDTYCQHDRLRPRSSLLPPTDAYDQLLGPLHARYCARHFWPRHEFRGCGDLYHEQRTEELPRHGGESPGDRAEPHGSCNDEH